MLCSVPVPPLYYKCSVCSVPSLFRMFPLLRPVPFRLFRLFVPFVPFRPVPPVLCFSNGQYHDWFVSVGIGGQAGYTPWCSFKATRRSNTESFGHSDTSLSKIATPYISASLKQPLASKLLRKLLMSANRVHPFTCVVEIVIGHCSPK